MDTDGDAVPNLAFGYRFTPKHGGKITGSDFFADKNVFGIALEVPNTLLGDNPESGSGCERPSR